MARSGGKGWIRYRLLGMIGGRDEFATSPICLPMGSEFYALGKKKTIDSSPPCFSWRSKGARGRGLSRSKPRSGERKAQPLQPPAPRSPSKAGRAGAIGLEGSRSPSRRYEIEGEVSNFELAHGFHDRGVPRPLRIEFPGARYHGTSRAIAGSEIVEDAGRPARRRIEGQDESSRFRLRRSKGRPATTTMPPEKKPP